MTKMILPNSSDGILHLPSGAQIRPRMTEGDFLLTKEGKTSSIALCGGGTLWRKLAGEFPLDDKVAISITLEFLNGQLRALRIVIVSGEKNWCDWSEEKELRYRDDLIDVAQKHYGYIRTFPWGSIDVSYDPRSGGSTLLVRYA